MIQAHELIRVIANRTYRDNWVGDFNNKEAVYEIAYEYSDGYTSTEQLVIPLMATSRKEIDKLAAIRDMLIKDFNEVRNESPFESIRTYIRKVAE